MHWIESWNRKVKQLTFWDMELVQVWTAAWVLVGVKIFPQITQLSVWWFVGAIVVCAPRLAFILLINRKRS